LVLQADDWPGGQVRRRGPDLGLRPEGPLRPARLPGQRPHEVSVGFQEGRRPARRPAARLASHSLTSSQSCGNGRRPCSGKGMIPAVHMPPRLSALLIEDDARLAALVAEYLGQNEVDVTIAGDGESGLALARGKQRFDIILLDLMLPRISGLEVCKRL